MYLICINNGLWGGGHYHPWPQLIQIKYITPTCTCVTTRTCVMTEIIEQKPQKSTTEHAKRHWRQFCGRSLPVIACILPQTSKGRCPVAEQSFGVYIIRIHHIVFELCFLEKEERNKTNKIEFFTFGFLTLIKVSRTHSVDLAIEQPRDEVYKLFAFVCFVFHGSSPIPYVQVAIMNLPHP